LRDIETSLSQSGLLEAIDDAVKAGQRIGFIGASNGGHVALELAGRYDAEWVILASSAPLVQQIGLCRDLHKPVIMTICGWESYFGGPQRLEIIAKQAAVYHQWCPRSRHCQETWSAQLQAAEAVRWQTQQCFFS
jgi:pimeloyl-ACP methyl ester carboxylesterase